MLFPVLTALLLTLPTITAQCIPKSHPVSNTISTPFAIEVHNASYPDLHDRRLNFWKAGGGDNHLYLSPAGDAVSNHTLVAGVLTNSEWWFNGGVTIRAVINGEVPPPLPSFRSFPPIPRSRLITVEASTPHTTTRPRSS